MVVLQRGIDEVFQFQGHQQDLSTVAINQNCYTWLKKNSRPPFTAWGSKMLLQFIDGGKVSKRNPIGLPLAYALVDMAEVCQVYTLTNL